MKESKGQMDHCRELGKLSEEVTLSWDLSEGEESSRRRPSGGTL